MEWTMESTAPGAPGRHKGGEGKTGVARSERHGGNAAASGNGMAVRLPSSAGSIADHVARRVGAEEFARHFDGKAVLRMNGRSLEVTVPSKFVADLMQRRYGPVLREAARDHVGGSAGSGNGELSVAFRVVEPPSGGEGHAGRAAEARGSSRAGAPERPSRFAKRQVWSRLEDFVVGESNKLAFAAAQRLAEDGAPGKSAQANGVAGGAGAVAGGVTRLFIHGRCGLGKTHLLQGIARRFQELHPGATVRYTTGEAFTNEFIAAVRAGSAKCDQFRRSYRGVDLLCIDDVHFLANKQATQGELLHTFDAIDLGGARVVLASDEHPRQVRSFSEALVSRFMAGAVVKLENPERELRERIASAIARRRGLGIDAAGIRLIADAAGPTCSVRDLEGMVTRVEAVWRLTHAGASQTAEPIGLVVVQRAVGVGEGARAEGRVRKPIRVEQVIESVCRALGVELVEFTGRGRHPRVVLARAITAWLSRKLTTSSFPEIARAMGRPNHSTIITAYQRIAPQIESNQSAELDGPWAGFTIGQVCERLGAEIEASA